MPQSGSKTIVAAALAVLGLTGVALAETQAPVQIMLKDHRFTPTEIHLPAGRPALLDVTNADATPEEFEMRQLAIEKVMVGGGKARVRLPPLAPGRYQFIGEYNEATAQGTIIVDAADAPKPQ
jgi:heme/copper-type cytochrome/quinol oxidase subunit 2